MPQKLRLESLEDAVAHAQSLHAQGYTKSGNWTLGQILFHVGGFMEMSRRGFPSELKAPLPIRLLRPVALYYILRFGFPKGVSSPPLLQPGPFVSDDEALARFASEVTAFEAHQGPLAPSPAFGSLPKEKWRRLHTLHAQHHLGFLVANAS